MNVYLYKLDEEYLKREEADILSVLPEWRISKYSKYTNEKAALLSLAAGAILVKAFKEEGRDIRDYEVEFGEFGKPYLKCKSADVDVDDNIRTELYFNLSHSGDYVAVCIYDREIGIDIENKGDKNQKVAKRVFSEHEKARIEKAMKGNDMLSEEDKLKLTDRMFRDIWTEKESYVKCTGDGISIPLNSFYVGEEDRRVYRQIDGNDVYDGTDYYVTTTRFDEDKYSLSVCAEKTQLSLDIVRVEVLV